jgi:hypothetical protein
MLVFLKGKWFVAAISGDIFRFWKAMRYVICYCLRLLNQLKAIYRRANFRYHFAGGKANEGRVKGEGFGHEVGSFKK